MLIFFLICLLVGTFTGLVAGLFGIGGGLLIVPILAYLLPMVGVPEANIMSMALGTSFATIVITSFSAAQKHHKLGNVDLFATRYLAPTLMISVFLAGLAVGKLPNTITGKLFACLAIYLALKMLFSLKPQTVEQTKPLTKKSILIAGVIIGIIASMAGIGGGGFIVPFLNDRSVSLKRAIGTSSLCGALLGISGAISFIIGGLHVEGLPHYSMGYVYLPALLGITATSFFTSRFGAWAANVLPVTILKRGFAILLILIAVNMFLK